MSDEPVKRRPGRPKGSVNMNKRMEIAGPMRGALVRAMKLMEANGKPLSEIWLDLFKNDPATAMRLAISMMPKEMDITTTDLTPEQWLEAMYEHKSESTSSTHTVPRPVH